MAEVSTVTTVATDTTKKKSAHETPVSRLLKLAEECELFHLPLQRPIRDL